MSTIPRRSVLALGAAAVLPGCSTQPQQFASLGVVREVLADLSGLHSTGAWSLAQVLAHAAQSIEYSIVGYPALKPTWFRASVGSAAWAWFDARAQMSHPLDQPIPGAPDLSPALPLDEARLRLIRAIDQFEQHTGALQPHFAYGDLDKASYARAHLLHICNHWSEIERVASA